MTATHYLSPLARDRPSASRRALSFLLAVAIEVALLLALLTLDWREKKVPEFAGAWVEHRGAEVDELLGRARVGDGDEDPRGEWSLGAHPARSAAFQRSTR